MNRCVGNTTNLGAVKEQISERFAALVREGQQLVQLLPRADSGYGYDFYVDAHRLHDYQAWLSAVGHLITMVSPPAGHYPAELTKLQSGDQMEHSVVPNVVERVFGLLTAAQQDWSQGLLRQIEYVLAAAAFDDFLDHAAAYHKGAKKIESAVLASAVLEDTVKKIAGKMSCAGRFHAVIATTWANASDGVCQPSVCRGRPFSSAATTSS